MDISISSNNPENANMLHFPMQKFGFFPVVWSMVEMDLQTPKKKIPDFYIFYRAPTQPHMEPL